MHVFEYYVFLYFMAQYENTIYITHKAIQTNPSAFTGLSYEYESDEQWEETWQSCNEDERKRPVTKSAAFVVLSRAPSDKESGKQDCNRPNSCTSLF